MSEVEELISKCVCYALSQDYCWFRMSFANIGQVEPSWVVWFERIGGVGLIDHTRGAKTLLEALQALVLEYHL